MKISGVVVMILALLMPGVASVYGQAVEAEVPGDNFSLEGALELFKKSTSPEDFERLLNSPDSKVNNLDLNGDGYVDYIRVFNRTEGNVHLFILQAVISDTESQDVAVIELEKQGDGKAVLQIVGNEDIYGVTTIIEPTREVRTYAGTNAAPVVVNVWAWPAVRYVYSPAYTVWVSPWGWHTRPVWYTTWRPITYVHYHRVWYPYRPYYTVCHTRRIVHAHHIYRPYRTTSVIVHNRHHEQIRHYRTTHRDDYRNGRTRTDRRSTYTDSGRPANNGRTYQSPNTRPSTSRDEANTRQRQRTQGTVKPNSNPDWSYTQRRSYENTNSGRESAAPRTQTRVQQTSSEKRNATPVTRPQSTNDNWRTTRPAEVKKPTEHRTYQQSTQRSERSTTINRSAPASRDANISRKPDVRGQQTIRSAPTQRESRSGSSGSSGNRNGNNGRSREINRGR